jgi:hypothetical protein
MHQKDPTGKPSNHEVGDRGMLHDTWVDDGDNHLLEASRGEMTS